MSYVLYKTEDSLTSQGPRPTLAPVPDEGLHAGAGAAILPDPRVFPLRHADAVHSEALADSGPAASAAPGPAMPAQWAPTSRQDATSRRAIRFSLPFGEFSWLKHPCASR
ncbi:hypothetical protein L665_01835 [Ralstonia solanacearum SD54]|nr:hypothetical protein F504_1947 [Ralstonia pseudosolanacearum FQY_4]ANH32729.1 hypothetical protein A3768_1573 [Ralstonia solanacearum]ESS49283.1 hypothetical protein L665_01835 [Ralstonia solanacearum SD54]